MKKSAFATIAIASMAGSAFAGSVGPDVIVGGLPSVSNWGSLGGVSAYSVATTSCNIGNQQLNWNPNTNVHPVIGQSISRVAPVGDNGTKIEMLGSSWLKHGFCALQQNLCGSCQPAGFGCPPVLGVGCSDPYSSGLNGSQTGLGLPAEVNPHTGFYPTNWTGDGTSGNVLFKRIQVQNSDLMTPGASYFIAGQYVQPEDSSFGNQDNNMSYRQAAVSNLNIFGQGQTFREEPVINAWKQVDSSVTLNNVNIPESQMAGDMTGLVVLGYDVSENNDGTWHYEYALNNISSDNRVRGFAIPGLDPADVTNFEFTDVTYHSGSPIDNTDWDTSDSTSDRFVVGGEAFSSNANANSLFWGRLYRIGFDSPNPPEVINAEIITFKTNEIVQTRVAAPQSATLCLGDCNEDGVVDFGDLTSMLFAFGNPGGSPAGCDANEDGSVNFGDLTAALFTFGPCP
jgi:hypothetical protein